MSNLSIQHCFPRPLFTASQVRELDNIAINIGGIAGIELITRAGQALLDQALKRWPELKGFTIFCGSGNNGGDGYIVAALAAKQGIASHVWAMAGEDKLKGDALLAYQQALAFGVKVKLVDDLKLVEETINHDFVVVDALLGTGLTGIVREPYQALIKVINKNAQHVVAADIPSGLCSDTGGVLGVAVEAQLCVTFIAMKKGLLTAAAPVYTGQLVLDDLGVDYASPELKLAREFVKVKTDCFQINRLNYLNKLKPRPADAHKGLFGHVLILGGDIGYGGAAIMAAQASARCGAGLTSVATQAEHIGALLARLPEVMVCPANDQQRLQQLLAKASVLVLGPGLGKSDWSMQLLNSALKTDLPTVLDADALNWLAEQQAGVKGDRYILTPHPGEAARLLGVTTAQIQADRFRAAKAIQEQYGGVVILKGAGTVITDGQQCLVAKVGNPGMATGGMGDILAGVVGALLAQGLTPLDAACLAVCVHGEAADLAVVDAGQRGLLASDLIPYIRQLLNIF